MMDQATIFETTERVSTLDRPDKAARDAFKRSLDAIGVELTTTSFEAAFARKQQMASGDAAVSETQMRALVDEVVSGTEIFEGVAESFR
ncbi:MAG: hypothetical protein WBM90_07725 [Acidimicrobiia bacterium]